MSEKQFKIGDKVIVIGKYEADNFWVGDIEQIDENQIYIKVGNQGLGVDINDLEHYDKNINWVEFYKNKYPHPEFWEGD